MSSVNPFQIFKSARKDFSLAARRQDLRESVCAIDTTRIVGKRIETEDRIAASGCGKRNQCPGVDWAGILKDTGCAGIVEAPLVHRGHGKTLFAARIQQLAFGRKEIEHVVGNEWPTDHPAALAERE